jgi:hypothetical protein
MEGGIVDQAEKARHESELEQVARALFQDKLRRLALLEHDDDPSGVQPGDLVVHLIMVSPPGGRRRGQGPLGGYRDANSRELMGQLHREISRRLPQVHRINFTFEDEDGHATGGTSVGFAQAPTGAGELTPVMVRLKPMELEVVDTLVSAGIATNRAEAMRWALARISERPAYAQLRDRATEIERLKGEF